MGVVRRVAVLMRRCGAPSQRGPAGFAPPMRSSSSEGPATAHPVRARAPSGTEQPGRGPLTVVQQVAEPHESSAVTFRYFTCVWARKSGRKHKKWEGDAVLRVGSRSVVLLDIEGGELGRGSGYRVSELAELQEGGRLGVGGKEVELTGETDQTV